MRASALGLLCAAAPPNALRFCCGAGQLEPCPTHPENLLPSGTARSGPDSSKRRLCGTPPREARAAHKLRTGGAKRQPQASRKPAAALARWTCPAPWGASRPAANRGRDPSWPRPLGKPLARADRRDKRDRGRNQFNKAVPSGGGVAQRRNSPMGVRITTIGPASPSPFSSHIPPKTPAPRPNLQVR